MQSAPDKLHPQSQVLPFFYPWTAHDSNVPLRSSCSFGRNQTEASYVPIDLVLSIRVFSITTLNQYWKQEVPSSATGAFEVAYLKLRASIIHSIVFLGDLLRISHLIRMASRDDRYHSKQATPAMVAR